LNYTPTGTEPIPPSYFDSFAFKVNDGTIDSKVATVEIVGPEDPVTPPGVATVDAKDSEAFTETGQTVKILLTADASDGDDPDTLTITEEEIGDLTFTITAQPPSGQGVVFTPPTSVTPQSGSIRAATVTYDPQSFTPPVVAPLDPPVPAVTTFTFQACGFIQPANTVPVCASADVTVSVGDPADSPPPVAESQAVVTAANTMVEVVLNADPEEEDPVDCPPTAPLCGRAQPTAREAVTGADIYFLVDVTGSNPVVELDATEAAASDIAAAVKAIMPDSRFGFGVYDDIGTSDSTVPVSPLAGSSLWLNVVSLGTESAFLTDIGTLSDHRTVGGDSPEAQFFAFDRLMNSANPAGFDPNTPSVIVWYGDAPGHDPICEAVSGLSGYGDITEQSVIAALTDGGPGWGGDNVIVVANSLLGSGTLDGDPSIGNTDYGACAPQADEAGQGTRITNATGGALLEEASASDMVDAVLLAVQSGGTGVLPDLYTITSLPAPGTGTLVDALGNPITVEPTTLPSDSVMFVPATGFEGTASFSFEISDAITGAVSEEATIYVNVGNVLQGGVSLELDFIGPGTGTVTTTGAQLCTDDCTLSFTPNAVITLEARPDGQFIFGGWGLSCTGGTLSNPLVLPASGTVSCTVSFDELI
jgi:hypothetical protein